MTNLVFKNQQGEVIRGLIWSDKKIVAFRSIRTGRVHFRPSEDLTRQEASELQLIKSIEVRSVTSLGHSLGKYGTISVGETNVIFQKDVKPSEEIEDHLPIFAKWATVGYVASIALLLLGTWVVNRYFSEQQVPTVVTVIEQNRQPETSKVRTVEMAKQKITRIRKNVQASQRNVKARALTQRKNPSRLARNSAARPSANQIERMGALGALGGLGGFSKSSRGGGGLNIDAKSGSGIGYGGVAARGGHERGLVGPGLVAAGIGNNRGVLGYGGLGTKGQGGGQPGYGSRKMGGTSAGFFQPLSEESFIEGGLDRDQINAVIQRNRGEITYCYERGLQQDPSLAGRVEVKFVINPVGRVSTAQVANTSLSARQVENCIVSRLRNWKFPSPIGKVNVRVTYPFLLQRISKG